MLSANSIICITIQTETLTMILTCWRKRWCALQTMWVCALRCCESLTLVPVFKPNRIRNKRALSKATPEVFLKNVERLADDLKQDATHGLGRDRAA